METRGAGGVFSAAEKVSILADVTALQTAHPITPVVVDSLSDALEHIDRHGTGHTDAIITENDVSGDTFLQTVDSSAVMLNASTRFNDGGEFGLGAEVAISTNKLHARGPMGLRELTSYKWLVLGKGHTRN